MIWLQACFVVFMGILFSTLNIAYLLMRYMMIKIALSAFFAYCIGNWETVKATSLHVFKLQLIAFSFKEFKESETNCT